MGFLEKLKNTFFEEEYVEVEEVEKPKKEPKPIAKKIENKRKREEDKKETAKNMLKKGYPLQDISEITNLSEKDIVKLKERD